MRARATIAIALSAIALAVAATPAAAQDRSATHAYILANYTLAQVSETRVSLMQSNVHRYIRRIASQCRGAADGSPQSEEAQRLGYEVAGALWSVAYGTDASAIRRFAATVSGLSWSNRKITRIARNYAKTLKGLATLRLPNLCGDVRAWAASGYRTIPAATISFDRHVEALEGHTIPARLLTPYASGPDQAILQRTRKLEVDLQNSETQLGFDDWNMLLETLGLNQ